MRQFTEMLKTLSATLALMIGMLTVLYGLVLVGACKPIRSAVDVLRSQCESDLLTELAIGIEATARNVPAQELARSFCKAQEIYSLWDKTRETFGKKLAPSEVPSKQAIRILAEQKQIRTARE